MPSKNGIAIGIFVMFEILFIVFMYMTTFYTPFRVIITGKKVKNRKDALAKGYGFYSDPEYGDCFSATGNCDTNGYRFVSWRCVPNLQDGITGCVTDDGLVTYNTIMEEQPCKRQCFSSAITLEENVVVNSQGVVSSVGTHNLIQKSTGVDVTDTYIGEFDQSEMAYKLKNCIPTTSDRNGNDLQGYLINRYTCAPGSFEGINGCTYMCGSDQTLNANATSTRNTDQFRGAIPYPHYMNDDGEKIYYCNDIQNNNSVEILNKDETVPDNFILPTICYSHANLFSQSITFTEADGTFWENDRYLYLSTTGQVLSQYFRLDYNMLSDPHSYVKMIVNDEIRLLSKYYQGQNGLGGFNVTSTNVGQPPNLCYIPFPANIYTKSEVENAGNITINEYSDIEIIKTVPGLGNSTVIAEGDYIFAPIDLMETFGFGDPSSGFYLYDEASKIIQLNNSDFSLGVSYYLYLRFDDGPFLPFFQEVTIENDLPKAIVSNFRGNPGNYTGTFSFYRMTFEEYNISMGGKTFSTTLDLLPITGNIFVDNFNEQNSIQSYLYKSVSVTVPFYIFDGSGFYYPLYLSKVENISYTEYKFTGYGNTIFYMPNNNSHVNVDTVQMDIPSYDYLRGRGIVRASIGSVSLGSRGARYLCNPYRITPGNDYNEDTYYRFENRNVFTRPTSLRNDYSILETSREGFPEYAKINFNQIVSNQIRRTVLPDEGGYVITIFPQKLLQIQYDFRKFLGPYTGEMENFICVDETNNPLPDGTIVEFPIGETVTALVPNDDFNTITNSACGEVRLKDGSLCEIKRDPTVYDLNKSCITYNPDGDYYPIESFLESGYLIEDDNELVCLDSDGNTLDDSRCTRPFLTDYWVRDKIYDVGEELIVNTGNTKLYISNTNNNTELPQTENWEEVSQIETLSFNTGQLLGASETYTTTDPGEINLKPGWALEYLTELKYRTDQEYSDTNGYYYNFDSFKPGKNYQCPYLETDATPQVSFVLQNQDLTSPVIQVTPPSTPNQNVFIDENYLNPLLWLMGAKNFLSNTTEELDSLQNISFAAVGDGDLSKFNSRTETELQLYNTENKDDLTGYYCYFIPLLTMNTHTNDLGSNSLFGRQWSYYIYNRLIQNRAEFPYKFEVVYVKSIKTEPDNTVFITFERNMTGIPNRDLLSFVDTTDLPDDFSGQFGLFLPFSNSGPLPRVNNSNPFKITFGVPSGYSGFIDGIRNTNGSIDIRGGKTHSFFTYGVTGFSVRQTITNPSHGNLVQYQPDPGRTSSMSYVRQIRVYDNVVFINEVRYVSENRVFNVGDTISFAGFKFKIYGVDVNLEVAGTDYGYELFDYVCSPIEGDFFTQYEQTDMFPNYVRDGGDRSLPSIMTVDPTGFVIKQSFNFQDPSVTTVTYTPFNDPYGNTSEATVQASDISFFIVGSNDQQNQFLKLLNAGDGILMKLVEIPLNHLGSSVVVTDIVGKATGIMSYVDGSTYDKVIVGKSSIASYTVNGSGSLITGTNYNINGYNFGVVEEVNLATVKIYTKSYTLDPERYRDVTKIYIKDELVLFKDYQTKIIYRNISSSPQKFNPDVVDYEAWSGSGSLHPQVDYKLYHDDQVYSSGDLVKYNDKLWTANINIGLPLPGITRTPPHPLNNNWTIFSPTGDLFSPLANFTAVLGNISFDTPAYIEQIIPSYGSTHFFPDQKYYFNRTYSFDFSNSDLIYFSNDSDVLDQNYNWIDEKYIAEIRYYFDQNEVTRSQYIANYNQRDNRRITMTVKRGSSSILSLDTIFEKSIIAFGTTTDTTGGVLEFYNNNDEISQSLIVANDLDNQNIPIRISDYGKFGNCFSSCIKNIVEDAYDTAPFGFIDLISSNLVSTWFDDGIYAYLSDDSFVSLPSDICRALVPISDRYLTGCFTSTDDNTNFCDYLYRIPKLTPEKYGVPYCTNFDLANSLLLYFVPMDIDSQNFIEYTVVSTSDNILEVDRFLPRNEYVVSGFVKSTTGVYRELDENVTVGARKTYLTESKFSEVPAVGTLYHLKNGDNEITLEINRMGLGFQTKDLDGDLSNFDYCWGTDTNDMVCFYGFVYNENGTDFTTNDIYVLGYAQSFDFYIPTNITLNVGDETTALDYISGGRFKIESFTLTKGDQFDITTEGNYQFSDGNISVNVFVANGGRIYQQGEVNYTGGSGLSDEETVYWKWKGDRCICKIYANYAGNNGILSYLETNQVSDLSGNSYIPIFYNTNKGGFLESPNNEIKLLTGDTYITPDTYMETFIIENGTIHPNPVQKPFNLSNTSKFYPLLLEKEFGIISSTTTANLYTTPLSDFTLTYETKTQDFFSSLNGDQVSTILSNNDINRQMLRLNKVRENYPNDIRECNIILPRTLFSVIQAAYEIVTTKFGFLEVKTGEEEITAYTNNTISLTQNAKPRFPLFFLVDGTSITARRTTYNNQQYLSIKYFLNEFEVSQAVYSAQTNLDGARSVRVEITYETKLDSDTQPEQTEITLGERGNFSIKIVKNS